jgi:hypothetical protein
MKLTDFRHFEPLNSLKEKMGIPRDSFGSLTVMIEAGRLSELELEKLTSQDGLEISLDDLRVLDDGTLAYKNSRVLLYIRDVAVCMAATNRSLVITYLIAALWWGCGKRRDFPIATSFRPEWMVNSISISLVGAWRGANFIVSAYVRIASVS